MYCHFAKENLSMRSAKTVINWTTGKVLAPHHACRPLIHNQRRGSSALPACVSVATLEPGCRGHITLWIFFFLFKDSPRGQAETVISPKLEHISQMWFSVAGSTNQTKWSWHWLLNVTIGWDWAKISYEVKMSVSSSTFKCCWMSRMFQNPTSFPTVLPSNWIVHVAVTTVQDSVQSRLHGVK